MTEATPGQESQTKPNESAAEPTWAKDLSKSLKEMGTGISALVTMAQNSQTKPNGQTQPPAEEPDELKSLADENNLELMPRKQLVERLEASFADQLEAALKPVVESIQQTQQNTLVSDYKAEAIRFADQIGPQRFGEWQSEMMSIAEKNPSLSVPDIYLLALAKNPAKAQEMETKYKTAEQPSPPKPAAKKPPLAMTPTSPPSGDVKNQKMSPDEAARSAWEESVAKFGNPFAPS